MGLNAIPMKHIYNSQILFVNASSLVNRVKGINFMSNISTLLICNPWLNKKLLFAKEGNFDLSRYYNCTISICYVVCRIFLITTCKLRSCFSFSAIKCNLLSIIDISAILILVCLLGFVFSELWSVVCCSSHLRNNSSKARNWKILSCINI